VSPLGRFLTIAMSHGNVSSSGPVVGQALSIAAAQGTVVPAVARAVTGQTVSIATSAGSVIAFIRAPVRLGRQRLRSVVEFGKPRVRSIVEFGAPRLRNAAGLLSPLQLPGSFMWFNADVVTTSGGDVTAWPNLISGVAATAGGTVDPAIEVVNGRNWVRLFGNGYTGDVGSWFTSTEPGLLSPMRYLDSRANFYAVITYRAFLNLDGENVLFSASQGAQNLQLSRLAVNTLINGFRATWFAGAGAGTSQVMRDTTTLDYDTHMVEISSSMDYRHEVRVDGVEKYSSIGITISDQNAFDIFSIGTDVRNGVHNSPANAMIRDIIGATDVTHEQRAQMRAFAAARAGIQL
jgi:hypothetical protein